MNTKKRQGSKGFTLIELLVVIAIIALLIGLLLPALAKAQRSARSLRDASQVKQIHQAMLIFSNDNHERLPIPGMINRLAYNGVQTIGLGKENGAKNHTRHLYSALIAQNFFNTDIMIGPTEISPFVKQRFNYRYSDYRPADDMYWEGDVPNDDSVGAAGPDNSPDVFNVRVDGEGAGVSHTSYAHLTITGRRKVINWRNTQAPADPIVSTRGTGSDDGLGGVMTGNDYTFSPTLELHGAKKQWVGNVAFNDNHTETIQSFFPARTFYEPQTVGGLPTQDNIFRAEFNDGAGNNPRLSGDTWLTITISMAPPNPNLPNNGNPVAIWDPLN